MRSGLKVAEAGKYRRLYGIVTPALLEALFDSRMLAADLLSRSTDVREAMTGRYVLMTLDNLRKELEGLME